MAGSPPMIVMTPPPPPPSAPTAASASMASLGGRRLNHPRRPAADRSVTLLHSPRPLSSRSQMRKSDSSSNDSGEGKDNAALAKSSATNTPSSLQLHGGRNSSGESSNADNWFDKSNNEVNGDNSTVFDNDPPFFLRNSSSSQTPPDRRQSRVQQLLQHQKESNSSLAQRAGHLNMGTEGSTSEDFRSVIDDLTIENKKLKKRLKKYEKLHDSHLKDEKLFEVRIHGLPADKKIALENALRKFAVSLGSKTSSAFPPDGYAGLLQARAHAKKPVSSQTSLPNTDSAYASMSTSGRGTSSRSAVNDPVKPKQTPLPSAASRQQNIHSYLHQIPEGLLPNQSPHLMSENAKKKLVVNRLEQLFVGKGAASGGHQQSLQQEEVSQSAARADRTAIEATGQKYRQEGFREAAIMSLAGSSEDSSTDDAQAAVKTRGVKRCEPASEPLEQRPTRPLDLDPQRAQIPVENIQYMRHLGFSPLDAHSREVPAVDHSWIYLNFLVNMAQLHTINVTADFVRKSINEYSDKLEISEDGRKLRWKGGASLTHGDSSVSGYSNLASDSTPEGQSPRKKLKLAHQDGARGFTAVTGLLGATPRLMENKYVYTPLFSHRGESSDSSDEWSADEDDDDMSSSFPAAGAAGDSTAMTSSGMQTNSGRLRIPTKKKTKRGDGPIIFYNNASFCTDLSGDHQPMGNTNAPLYSALPATAVGSNIRKYADPLLEARGPLAYASELPEPIDLVDNPIPHSMELNFPPGSPLSPVDPFKIQPKPFEVTGIGGVWPADNFAITVQSQHAKVHGGDATGTHNHNTHIPDKLLSILKDEASSKKRDAIRKQVVASRMEPLPPSDLPPAIGFVCPSEDSEDEASDVEDDYVHHLASAFPPSAAPQSVNLPVGYNHESEEEEEFDDDDDQSEGSLDLLAAARELDPEAIRAREREYDADLAERLAEEIPAGSSAATAGGGSGYASPVSGVLANNHAEYKRALRSARKNVPAALTAARTNDSMSVQDARDEEMSDIRS